MWTRPHCLLICTATCQVTLGKGLQNGAAPRIWRSHTSDIRDGGNVKLADRLRNGDLSSRFSLTHCNRQLLVYPNQLHRKGLVNTNCPLKLFKDDVLFANTSQWRIDLPLSFSSTGD
jgi:hypothetical protein